MEGSFDKFVQVWNVDDLTKPTARFNANSPVTSVAFHPNGNYVAAGLETGSIHMWDLRSKELVWYTPPPSDDESITSISFHPSGAFLLISSAFGQVHMYDCKKGHIIWSS